MANIIGGIIWPNNHLSINGIKYQGMIILLMVFLISDWLEFSKNLFNFYFLAL